ncbi:hypothetical protein [Bacillus pseudomycoides]|uniref:hypothetical protein n=1 Tax=Bacillus pseudomycoides TaxID=64104 RepID=UPI000BED9895|nr:hypothetical protein [Bacillus pseudomycoides]PED05911.1 hypothetical protein COO19_23765 [Bacillus pseudomycoides]PEI97058.1 hypothetical protein CN686_10335 [Bacillus pseudomycoides]PEK11112.1 hypothetical protein CN693_26625 [Bacillus pseudomycoides]PEM76524.1 hypothetical protein CN619_07270 [Bacillus pseudomycoides]PEO13203.1 hypothetical protein CN542_19320 [Bacillus pseudomycoides]
MEKKRRKIYSNIIMVVVLGGLLVLIFMTKESKIKGFPVPMSAIHIEDDNQADYQYISLMPISKVKGWENLGEDGHTVVFQKGDRKVIVLRYPGENTYYLFEE